MDKPHTFSPAFIAMPKQSSSGSSYTSSMRPQSILQPKLSQASHGQSQAQSRVQPSVVLQQASQQSASMQEAQNAAAQTPSSAAKRNSLVSRNITVAGHRTSARLEPAMWAGFSEICRRERMSMHDIATAISQQKPANTSLTAAIRVFVMAYFRAASTEDGHLRAGHGRGAAVIASVAPAFVAMTAAQALPYVIGTRHPSGTR